MIQTFLKSTQQRLKIPKRPSPRKSERIASPPVCNEDTGKGSPKSPKTSSSFFTPKELSEIRGCKSDMDDISLLTFIAESFQVRPNWEFEECETTENVGIRFLAKLDFSGQ